MAEFPLLIFLIDGTQGCAALTIMEAAIADPCNFAVVEKCVPAGTYWVWVGPSVFDGVTCGAQYCAELTCEPCTVPAPIACPTDSYTNVWQLAYGEDEAWSISQSNAPCRSPKLYEHFAGVGTPVGGGGITDIHWWGVSATFDDQGNLVECPLNPGNFHIGFWGHDTYTNRPDYASGELFGFDATGAALTKTDTGHVYRILNDDGSVDAAYTLWAWGADLPTPLTMFAGWITIQNLDNCRFWWAGSPGPPFGVGGIHVVEDQSVTPPTRQDVDGDLSWCLTSDQIGPFTGACCDRGAGVCRNTTSDECVGAYDEFHSGLAVHPDHLHGGVVGLLPCGECSMETLSDCTGAGGDWFRFYVCSTTDPSYDPDAFGPGLNNLTLCPPIPPLCPITCETPAAFSRGLAGGYLYISWDRGPDDQRYVIDSFTGWSDSTHMINRVKWWGNSTIVWDGPDCDFDNPAPFAIKFYHPSGSGPDYRNPAQTYDPVDCTWLDTGYMWTCCPEWGAIDCYYADLSPTYYPGTSTQWISIASKTEDCDFIWAPGPRRHVPGQWFYDHGTAAAEPGLRHRSFCLNTNIATGACCNELTGVCTNGVQQTECLAAEGKVFYRNMTCAAVPAPGCIAHPGACCNQVDGQCSVLLLSDCTAVDELWLGPGTACAVCCITVCPPGSAAEGEPPCGDGYVDTYNGGCDTAAQVFQHVEFGQTICGDFGTFKQNPDGSGGELRDSDWYRFHANSPALVRLHVEPGEIPVTAAIYATNWPASPCDLELVASGSNDGCAELVVSGALEHGRFVATIAPTAASGVPCEAPYTAWLEALPAGACRIGEDCVVRSAAVCAALGGSYAGAGQTCSWNCGSRKARRRQLR